MVLWFRLLNSFLCLTQILANYLPGNYFRFLWSIFSESCWNVHDVLGFVFIYQDSTICEKRLASQRDRCFQGGSLRRSGAFRPQNPSFGTACFHSALLRVDLPIPGQLSQLTYQCCLFSPDIYQLLLDLLFFKVNKGCFSSEVDFFTNVMFGLNWSESP